MSFGEQRKEPSVDMKRFRRDLRRMWAEMRRRYQDGTLPWYNVKFPEVEYVRSKRDQDDESRV